MLPAKQKGDALRDEGESLTVRTFLAPPDFFDGSGLKVTPGTSPDTPATVENINTFARKELSDRGIRFPPGSTVTFLLESSKLVVRNTPEQLDLIAEYKTVSIPATPREFVTADVGVKAEITPSLEQGKIVLNGKFSVTNFEGFTKSDLGPQMPSFETRETHFLEALDDNQLKGILIPGGRFDEQTITDKDDAGKIISVKKETVKELMPIFLSAGLVK
jgi:hypothetical protein